jgi:glyoxylase I family protein
VARVTGIGGFFFRARDPEALNRWYGEHLGVIMMDSRTYDDPGWFQDRGETVFSAIDADSAIADPEGNRVQLWEPNAASVARDGSANTAIPD